MSKRIAFARPATGTFIVLVAAVSLAGIAPTRPAPQKTAASVDRAVHDPLSDRLATCRRLAARALEALECASAWAENRRRFFGVDYPGAYADIMQGAKNPSARGGR